MKKFIVALEVGGLMECPSITYKDIQIINANTAQEAEDIYNEINRCNYFYGKVIGEYEEDYMENHM